MRRAFLILLLCFVAAVLPAQEEEEDWYAEEEENSSLVVASGGLSYTDMKYTRILQDNQTANGTIYSLNGPVHNSPGASFGLAMTTRKERFFHFYMGAFVTTAKAYGDRSIFYDGIDGQDSMKSEVLRYQVTMLEIPLQIGWSFSKRKPVTLTAGITLGLPMTNLSRWNYQLSLHRMVQDPQGNWIPSVETHRYSDDLSVSSSIAYPALLTIPLKKFNGDFISVSFGLTGYMSAITHLVYSPAVSYDIMRMKHSSYVVRLNVPVNITKVKKPKKVGDG